MIGNNKLPLRPEPEPYSKLPSGFGLAFLTDPWGTYIELTEGLREIK